MKIICSKEHPWNYREQPLGVDDVVIHMDTVCLFYDEYEETEEECAWIDCGYECHNCGEYITMDDLQHSLPKWERDKAGGE